MRPKVSILCITYNQSKFIGQALNSFLAQKTDFPFEIIIHDDKSTDGTTEIVKDYTRRFPAIIKPTYEKTNQYSKANFSFITDQYKTARGAYIATCEGDDYWTDETKLQQQVDFLDKNPDYAISFHPAKVIFENSKEKDAIFPEEKDSKKFTIKQLLKANYISTSSVLYRNTSDYVAMQSDPVPGDWYAHLYHAATGKIGFINRPMSVYRRHIGGVWWNQHEDITKIWRNHGIGHLKLYAAMLKLFEGNPEYTMIVAGHVNEMMNNILKLDDAHDLKVKVLKDFPEMSINFTIQMYDEYGQKIHKLEQREVELKLALDKANEGIAELTRQLTLIHSSRIWKARNGLVRIVGKEKV